MDMNRVGGGVIGVFIDALGWEEVVRKISAWSAARESRYVCFCNVHSVVTASQDNQFKNILAGADMALPDGMPVAWMLRRLGRGAQQRINGPDLMWRYCAHAELTGESVFFFGSSDAVLESLRGKLREVFPRLNVAGHHAPPFRPLTVEEDDKVVARINRSGARIVFVGLGCPKQEAWMAEHRGRVNAVMMGVGAAFSLHAGTVERAPVWMQKSGLEWLHRLALEPRRLWRRYLVTNTLFILKSGAQLLAHAAGALFAPVQRTLEREATHTALPVRPVGKPAQYHSPYRDPDVASLMHRLTSSSGGRYMHLVGSRESVVIEGEFSNDTAIPETRRERLASTA